MQQIVIVCSECGHQEWGRTDAPLMNKIKLFNHANKRHPESVEEVMHYSLPRRRMSDLQSV